MALLQYCEKMIEKIFRATAIEELIRTEVGRLSLIKTATQKLTVCGAAVLLTTNVRRLKAAFV